MHRKQRQNTKAYKNFKKKAEEQNVEIKHPNVGDEIQLGSSTVEFLGPVDENGKDLNSTSIVIKITYGNTSSYLRVTPKATRKKKY